MDKYVYEEIPTIFRKTNKKVSWKPFLRQLLVSSSVWSSFFAAGLCFGSPTVIVPQLRREANSTTAITDEMASWLSAVYNYASLPWFIILPLVLRNYGRKYPYIFLNAIGLAGFIIMYCSITFIHLIISGIIHGILFAAQLTFGVIILTEYTSPRNRGIFLTIKSASFSWGIWVANAIGTFTYWKSIALFGMLCAVYCILVIVLLPESPIWLASKGRLGECSNSHRWIKGGEDESEKELDKLLNSHDSHRKDCLQRSMRHTMRLMNSKMFWKPLSLCISLTSLHYLSGKFVCTIYAIDIIKKITMSEATAYKGMLILDGATVAAMYIGCVISKYLKRRTLLLVSTSLSIMFLFILSLYLYLIRLSVIQENKYVSILLLAGFSMAICCGPMILSTSIFAELIPIKGRNFTVCVAAFISSIVMGTVIKIAPTLFKVFGLAGTFLFYGLSASMILMILYKYLPETKDKTLQEIQDTL